VSPKKTPHFVFCSSAAPMCIKCGKWTQQTQSFRTRENSKPSRFAVFFFWGGGCDRLMETFQNFVSIGHMSTLINVFWPILLLANNNVLRSFWSQWAEVCSFFKTLCHGDKISQPETLEMDPCIISVNQYLRCLAALVKLKFEFTSATIGDC